MTPTPPDRDAGRIGALDLVRGLAVLGILAINVASFAGPDSIGWSPAAHGPASRADTWIFAIALVLFEGKMRALFSILFGASLLLFVERAESRGRDGERLQLRRLGWLALLGYLHFALLWKGDILFPYAFAGVGALALRRADPLPALATALLLFTAWQGWGMARWLPAMANEQAVLAASDDPATIKAHDEAVIDMRGRDREGLAVQKMGFAAQVRHRLTTEPGYPVRLVLAAIGETMAYVLIGMALLRSGFFSGGWSRRQLGWTAGLGIGLGGLASLAFALWAMPREFPEMTMHFAISYALAFPHLAMAMGYAALVVLGASAIRKTGIGARIEAAGRMALSNYIGTTVVMTAVFGGWGLGLAGTMGWSRLALFVLLGWALMLAWSKPWLARFRQGPLEWLWRSLTEGRRLPFQ